MACPCSCNCKIFDFGVYDCSECLELPLEAVQDGEHNMYVEWRDKVWYIKGVFAKGEPLKFKNILNEDSTVNFKIIQPDKTQLEYKTVCNNVVVDTFHNFSLTIKQVLTYEEETATAQEICGSELSEDGSTVLICSTF